MGTKWKLNFMQIWRTSERGAGEVSIKELKKMLDNIGLVVEVARKRSDREFNLMPSEEVYKENTIFEGHTCNIKNWAKFRIWINKSNKVTIKSHGVQKSFDIKTEDELVKELEGFEIYGTITN